MTRHTALLKGMPASPGFARGAARLIANYPDPGRLPDGSILVSRTTDPGLILHMMKSAAIVTEIGGRLCHTAIVALELGIPCVVAVPDACKLIAEGQFVEVDGESGEVYVLPK